MIVCGSFCLCGAVFKYIQKQTGKCSEFLYTCHPDGTVIEVFSFPFLFSLLKCFKANPRHCSISLLHASDCVPLTYSCFLRQAQSSVHTSHINGDSFTHPLCSSKLKFPGCLFLELVCLNQDPTQACTWRSVTLFLTPFLICSTSIIPPTPLISTIEVAAGAGPAVPWNLSHSGFVCLLPRGTISFPRLSRSLV